MASYLKKEISEWNTNDLCNWLLANKFRGISELCQKHSISGYDLFFINDDILKNELNLKSFHERKIALKLFTKLTYEHLKLNIINSNGDNVILTLDNNPETQLGEISDYIGNMFNINPKNILYKDSTRQQVLSPTVKIIPLLILYPKIYKTLNVSNMKDYHQIDEELMEEGIEDFQVNKSPDIGIGYIGSGFGVNDNMDYQEKINNYKMKYNNDINNPNNIGNNKKRELDGINNNIQKNNEKMNYKYKNINKNNYMKMKNNIRHDKNNNDNLLNVSGNNNFNELVNDNNINNINGRNIENNQHNHKSSFIMENNKNKEYQNNFINNNLGRQIENEEIIYRDKSESQRQNNQYKRGSNEMMKLNDENANYGLSNTNDDEMQYNNNYQVKNMENNYNNF